MSDTDGTFSLLDGVETPMHIVVAAANRVHVPKRTTQNHDRTVNAVQDLAVLLAIQMGNSVAAVHHPGKREMLNSLSNGREN